MATPVRQPTKRTLLFVSVVALVTLISGFSGNLGAPAQANPYFKPQYYCPGYPYDGSASNVCHALAITTTSAHPKGGGAQQTISSMGCENSDYRQCNSGWITNQVKLADGNGNFVEAGLFYGNRYDNTSDFHQESVYWADSRPQDTNTAYYHLLGLITQSMVGSNLRIDIVRNSNPNIYSWAVNLYGPGFTYTGSNYTSTNNTFDPTSIQMGEFLIGTSTNRPQLYADKQHFGSRYYLDSNFARQNIFGNYSSFQDLPPYFVAEGTGNDFATYCCNVNHNHNVVTRASSTTVVASTSSSTPVGIPAVQHVSKLGAAANADQSITANDVTTYVERSGMPLTADAKSTAKVLHARLMTSKDISVLLRGENTGFPDSKMLWFVDVNGTFNFIGAKGAKDSCHHGVEIFDPSTGNLVLVGGMQ